MLRRLAFCCHSQLSHGQLFIHYFPVLTVDNFKFNMSRFDRALSDDCVHLFITSKPVPHCWRKTMIMWALLWKYSAIVEHCVA